MYDNTIKEGGMTVDHRIEIPVPFPSGPFGKFGMFPTEADPFGSYTGIPEEVMDKPVQDADDL